MLFEVYAATDGLRITKKGLTKFKKEGIESTTVNAKKCEQKDKLRAAK